MPTLLVIDDEPLTRDCFQLLFPKGQVRVLTAPTAAEGESLFRDTRPDAVVLDVRLPDASGVEAFRRLREIDPKVPVVLMTGFGTADTAIEAMRQGAYEYILKPLDPDRLRELIVRAFEIGRLMHVRARLPSADEANGNSDILIGNSPAMQEVYKAVGRVAGQDVTVLILGESGTGKEMVARAVYHYSKRASGLFLAVNCAAIPETLLECELFGHEKGAFTGADRRRIGKFEQADGGTLFLDEIGDLSPLTQAKMLRVLQERAFERVGGNELIRTDVRVIAATNRDLGAMAANGRFREDLYYRLNVYTIYVPPLRDRGDDLTLLVEHLVRQYARELGKDITDLPAETLAALRRYPWPGNVRELQSVLKQAILKASGPSLRPEFLPAVVNGDADPGRPASGRPPAELDRYIRERIEAGTTDLHSEYLALTERHLFLEVFKHVGFNLTRAARTLGISRTTLRARLTALGITLDRSTTIYEGCEPDH